MHDIDEAARQERRGTKWKRSRSNGECSAVFLAGSVESTGQQRRRKTTLTSTALVRINFRLIQAFRLSGGNSENIQYRRIRNIPSESWSDAERMKNIENLGFTQFIESTCWYFFPPVKGSIPPQVKLRKRTDRWFVVVMSVMSAVSGVVRNWPSDLGLTGWWISVASAAPWDRFIRDRHE